ncbi:MAG: tryptophan 2,3-dioxygenase [Gemmataceae bacterium]
MDLTYSTYLHLDELLDLQRPRSQPPEHDEMLFIIIHQVHELWFKQMLHELAKVRRDFRDNALYDAIATFKRLRMILKTVVGQVDILETLTPLSFSIFRDRLENASGFQSVQFRELEFMLGYKRPELLRFHQQRAGEVEHLQQRLRQPSVVDAFYDLLEQHGVIIPQALRQRDMTLPAIPDETVQEGVLHLYKTHPDMRILFEYMTDFDEGFQEWRYRHVKLVERTIGNKVGTGGSLGVEFLKQALFRPIFADLWAIRHKL